MTLSITDLIAEADRCVACGLCLPHCPTYRKTGSEADSPRGRIQLMRAVAQDILPNNQRFKQHIDLCLSCRSCESACPNNVNYGALVDSTRAILLPKKSIWYRLAKPLIRSRLFSNGLMWLVWLIQQCKCDALLKCFNPAAKLLPAINHPVSWQSLYPTTVAFRQGSVSLFLGCASQALDNQTLKASIYLLNTLGFDVYVPAQQTCCGSIARQMGDELEANQLLAMNQHSFNATMPILTVASGCGAGLADYMPSHQVQDISAFLAACDWSRVSISPLKQRIFVQDPCSLRNGQKSHAAVYSLLKKIPQAEVLALAGNSQCCGGAGSYMLTQASMANDLLNDKLMVIEAASAAILATSNIGCSLHIAKGLREQNMPVVILHPVQIMAKQLGFVNQ